MKDNDGDSDHSSKSSRRRRWDVKSKESFNSTLAFEVTSPSENNTPKFINKTPEKDISSDFQEENEANISDDNSNIEKNSITRKETLLKMEECFNENEEIILGPTAPPLSPPPNYSKEDDIIVINSTISHQLNELNEDVVTMKKFPNDSNNSNVAVSGVFLGPASSTFNGNVSTIYCEKLNNFVLSNDDKLNSQTRPKEINIDTHTAHAICIQTGFRTFSVMCQGILAGITISHCILAFIMKSDSDLYTKLNIIEHIFFALIIFLTSICLVSAFDRCDLAGQGIFSEHGLQIPWTPLLYFISFTLSLVMVRAESFFTYFKIYPKNIQDKKEEMMIWWQYMALSRTIIAVLAWSAQAANPNADALNDRITQLAIS